jgi:hypothetical protein
VRRWFIVPLVAFGASRLLTVAVAYAARFFTPGWGIVDVFTKRWDATWYLEVARNGYPSTIPPGEGDVAQSSLGFFPLYPIVTRGVGEVLGVDLRLAAVLVNLVAGAVATVLLWRLAEALFGEDTAHRAVFLFCFFPGAYALSLAYSEALFLAFAIGCLLLLEQRRWWWAAVVGGIGSAARPTGYALALCCAFAVVLHWRRTRDWRPLASPVVAAGGFLAFLAYLHVHTGNALAYQDVQRRGWNQGLDLGTTTARRIVDYALDPNDDLNLLVPVLSVLGALVLLWLLVRTRPPGILLVYAGATLLPGFLSTSVALTPRHLLVAFPVVLGPARALRDNAYACALAVFAGGLALLTLLIVATYRLTP